VALLSEQRGESPRVRSVGGEATRRPSGGNCGRTLSGARSRRLLRRRHRTLYASCTRSAASGGSALAWRAQRRLRLCAGPSFPRPRGISIFAMDDSTASLARDADTSPASAPLLYAGQPYTRPSPEKSGCSHACATADALRSLQMSMAGPSVNLRLFLVQGEYAGTLARLAAACTRSIGALARASLSDRRTRTHIQARCSGEAGGEHGLSSSNPDSCKSAVQLREFDDRLHTSWL